MGPRCTGPRCFPHPPILWGLRSDRTLETLSIPEVPVRLVPWLLLVVACRSGDADSRSIPEDQLPSVTSLLTDSLPETGDTTVAAVSRAVRPSPSAALEAGRTSAPSTSPRSTPEWIDPTDLEVGRAYKLSRATPLMPSPNPADPMRALREAKQIQAGGEFRVRAIDRTTSSTPWYRVEVNSKQGIIRGWINSTALMGQALQGVSR